MLKKFQPLKLDVYIRECGICSRRKAYDLISEKRVTINGKLANHSSKLNIDEDAVRIDKELIQLKQVLPIYIAYHKPKGIICTSEKIEGNIIDAVNHSEKIIPVGRLDKNSEGLILLTNQAALVDKIANASQNHEKEYLVTLNLPIRKQFLEDIRKGVDLMGETTKPCKAELETNTKRVMRITLTQGMNRQIRRMCGMYKYQVIKLQRVRVMNILLGNLKLGEWRELEASEVNNLLEQVSN